MAACKSWGTNVATNSPNATIYCDFIFFKLKFNDVFLHLSRPMNLRHCENLRMNLRHFYLETNFRQNYLCRLNLLHFC